MIKLTLAQLRVPENEFRESLERYKTELAAHASTIGVPAPLPDFDLIYLVVKNGGDFELEQEPDVVEPEPGKTLAQTIVDQLRADPVALASLKEAVAIDAKLETIEK